MVRLLQRSAVSYQLLHHLPVHEGLPAKEIHLQIDTVPGICHQKIQCLFPYLKAHQRTSPVVFALSRKAVSAGQIAVVGNVQAQRFHHSLPVLERIYIILIDILCKELSGLLQGQKLLRQFLRLKKRNGKLLCHRPGNFFLIPFPLINQPFHHRNRIIGRLVHHMHTAAVDIHHNMEAIIDISVYH